MPKTTPLAYLHGIAHGILLACAVLTIARALTPMAQDRNLARTLAPYTVIIEDDCYLERDAPIQSQAIRLDQSMVENLLTPKPE